MIKGKKLTYSIIAALLFSGPILHQLDLIPDNMAIKINDDCMDSSESVSDCSLRIQALSFLWPTHIVIDRPIGLPESLPGIPYDSDFIEFQVKNGLKHGVAKWYYYDGQLYRETPYENDKRHGIEKDYYENGLLREETPYENGKIHGVIKGYHENGQLWYEKPYVNDEKHGVGKEYHENGQLKSERLYKNGLTHGVEKIGSSLTQV